MREPRLRPRTSGTIEGKVELDPRASRIVLAIFRALCVPEQRLQHRVGGPANSVRRRSAGRDSRKRRHVGLSLEPRNAPPSASAPRSWDLGLPNALLARRPLCSSPGNQRLLTRPAPLTSCSTAGSPAYSTDPAPPTVASRASLAFTRAEPAPSTSTFACLLSNSSAR